MVMMMMTVKMMMAMTTGMTVRVELIRRLLSGEISHCTASHHRLVKPAGLGLIFPLKMGHSDNIFSNFKMKFIKFLF